jgi:hypothetical protein
VHQVAIGRDGSPERYPSAGAAVRFEVPQRPTQLHWLCRFVSESLEPRYTCLLWVKESGTFPSAENLHLYYRLRQSYGDLRLIEDAPGHLFLQHEAADCTSFLQIGIINGWEMHLFPELAYGGGDTARAVIAHDNEWIAIYHREVSITDDWRSELERSKYTILSETQGWMPDGARNRLKQ